MSVVINFFSHHATYTHICTHSFTPHAWTAKLSCLLVAQSGTFSFADAKWRVTVLIIIIQWVLLIQIMVQPIILCWYCITEGVHYFKCLVLIRHPLYIYKQHMIPILTAILL